MATFVDPSRRVCSGTRRASRDRDRSGKIRAALVRTAGNSRRIAYAALVGAALLMPRAAAAQSGEEAVEDVRQNARIHVGPLYASPSLMLKEFGIDNNVFNVYGDRQQSDFTLTFTPKADLWLTVAKRALIRATTAADLVWYEKFAGERSVDPTAALRGELYLQRITLFGEGSYLNTRQRPNQDIDVRARHVDQQVGGGTRVALTPEVSVELAARQTTTRYDPTIEYDNTSLQRTLNRDNEMIGLRARYRLTSLTSLAVRYERERDTFELSPWRNSESYRVMPGVELKPRALVNGSAYVGYRKFTPADPTILPGFEGLVAQLTMSYTLLGATTFGVSGSRDLTYSYEELQPFFIDNSVGASVRRALGRRFDVLASADRHLYEYQQLLTSDLPLAERAPRTDLTWNYQGSFGYRLGRNGRAGIGASYWQRDSTSRPLRDYNNLRFGGTVSFGF
jgi:hypothetical protein